MLRRLDEARLEWEASGQSDTYLLTGGRLAQHLAWTATTTLALSQAELEFLAASGQHDERLKIRSRRRRSYIMGGFAAAAAVALVFAFSASRSAADARVRSLTQASLNIVVDDPELAVLLAAEAVEMAQSRGSRPPAETLGALWSAHVEHRLVARFDELGDAAVTFSPDGQFLAVDSRPRGLAGVTLIDWESGEVHATLPASDADSSPNIVQIEYSPDGSLIAVARAGDSNGDGVVEVFSTETYELVSRLSGETREYFSIDFADSGALVGLGWLGDRDWSLTLWDPSTGTEESHIPDLPGLVGELSRIARVNVVPGTHEVVIGVFGEDSVAVIDLNSAAVIETIPIKLKPGSTALSPDGAMLAVSGNETVEVFDTATWEPIIDPVVHQDPQTLVWSPDGTQLAASGNDSDVTIISVPSEAVTILSGHKVSVYSTAFHPTSEFVASVSIDNDVRLWDISDAGPARGSISLDPMNPYQLEAVGGQVVAGVSDEGVWVIDPDTGQPSSSVPGSSGAIVADQAHLYAAVDIEGKASILNLDGSKSVDLPDCSEPMALSPNGRYAVLVWTLDDGACAETSGHAVLYDTVSGGQVGDFGDANLMFAMVTAPTEFDGQQYVALTRRLTETTNEVEIWSVDPLERVGVVDMSMAGDLIFLRVSASTSGRYIGIGTNGPRSLVLDLAALVAGATMDEAIIFNVETHIGNAPLVQLTDSGLVASGAFDGFYRWWDLETRDLVFEIEVDGLREGPSHDFTVDGRYYHYEDGDGVIRRIPTDIDEMMEQALSSVTRGFTDDECRRYLESVDCG